MWDWLSTNLDLGRIQPGDKVGLIAALVTGLGSLGAVLALIFAALSARAAARQIELSRGALDAQTLQMELSREALRAETFLNVMSYEREIHFSCRMDSIRSLPNNIAYNALTPEQRNDIRAVVDFLNHVGHLIRYGYVSPRQMLLLYTPALEKCQEVLIDRIRWLDHFRKQAGKGNEKLYLHFESLCKRETQTILWDNGEVTFTGDIYERPKSLNQNGSPLYSGMPPSRIESCERAK